MKRKRSGNDQHSTSHEFGIFLFLTLVIFFGAIGFPTLINTSPTIGYDDNTIAKLTPVTTYYQEAFAEQEEFGILSNYYFDPIVASAFLVMPTTLDNLPPPDPDMYFELKYSQAIEIEHEFIETDRPELVRVQDYALLLQPISNVPISWLKIYYYIEKPVFEEKLKENIFLPSAYGAEFYVKQTDIDSVVQGGSGTSCPTVTSPSSATLGGGLWTLKRDSSDTLGCSYGILSYDNVLLPLELENALSQSTEPIFWGVDFSSTAWNSADNSGSVGCRIYPVSGASSINPNTDGRINATGAYEQIQSLTNVLVNAVGSCDSDINERYSLVDPSATNKNDYLNRINNTFYQVGTNIGGITGRDTSDRSVPATNTFLKYSLLIPANHTDNFWQMQEHPMYDATFPAISTGSMQNLTNALQLDTGDVNSEVGQVIVFKAFNKTDLGVLGDIRVVGEFQALGVTSDMQLHIEVKEGNIQAGQVQNIGSAEFGDGLGHFPKNERMLDVGLFENQFETKSLQNINNSLSVIDITADSVGVIQPFDISLTPFWGGSQDDIVTVMVGIQDNSASGRMTMNITSIEIEDEVKYDFESINDIWFNEPDCSTEMATGTFALIDLDVQHVKNCGVDYSNGLTQINTVSLSGVTGVPNPTPDAVTGLIVTFIGDIANLTWNHPQTNVTSFQIERDIGTGFQTIFYVPSGKLTTVDRTSQDLADLNSLFGLPRSTSISYRVTPMNGAISGTADTDTKTSNTISDDWQWKEYNLVSSIVVNQTIVEEGGSEKRLMMNFVTTIANRQGDAWLFKVFPKAFIESKQIEVDWEGTKTGAKNGGTLEGQIKILDGVINRFNTTQFNVTVGGVAGQVLPSLLLDFDSVDFEGAPFDGALGRETKIVLAGDPSWGSSTSDLITLAVLYHDGGGKEGNLKIASIKVDDAFYNFSNSIIITEEQNVLGEEGQNGIFDFNTFDPQTQQDTGLVIPSSANVTISTPINFQVIQDGANESELDWSDSLGADNYQVFRNGTLIGSPILSEFTDTTLSLGMIYEYKVRANNTGGISANSTIINFGLIDPLTGLIATALTSSSIKLDWDLASTEHETDPLIGIQIKRNGTVITTVDELDTTFTDTLLTPSTNYVYNLKAVSTNSSGVEDSDNTNTLGITSPEAITDLNIIIKNSTAIYSAGASGATQVFDKFPTIITQIAPTFTNPTLIDSIQIDIKETGVTALPTGIVKAVIIGDRTGDLTDGSLLSNIYFIENSTNTISTALLPALTIFNFSGNTILDSNDNDVGIGIIIDSHDAEILMDLFGSGAFGKMVGTGADCAGDNLVFDDESCTGVATSDLSGLNIYGGNGRAILNWTAPADNGDAITGYKINVANATELMLYKEMNFPESNAVNATIGDDTNGEIVLGTGGDPNGHFAGQRISFPYDVVVTTLVISMGTEDQVGGVYTGGDVQAVILKDSPVGTSSFTRVANSSSVNNRIDALDDAFFFGNPPNCCGLGFSFEPTTLSKDVEYIIGVEPVDVSAPVTVFADFPDNLGFPNAGSNGVFTQLNPNVASTWLDNSTLNLNAQIFGYNLTVLVEDTGTTTTEFTDTVSSYPSSDGKINQRVYSVEAINGGGNANASNFVELSPDRDLPNGDAQFDTWSFKEQDTRHLFNTDCSVGITTELGALGDPTSSSLEMIFDGTAGGAGAESYTNTCSIFKSFDRLEMNGSDINIKWNSTHAGAPTKPFIRILDGEYDKDNSGDFIKGENPFFTPKGDRNSNPTQGHLNVTGVIYPPLSTPIFGGCTGDLCDVTIPASVINYSSAIENKLTIQFEGFFGSGSIKKFQIGEISVTNIGTWDFTNNPRIIDSIANGRAPHFIPVNSSEIVSVENLAWEDDRSIIVANSVFNGTVTIGGVNSTQTETDFATVIDNEDFDTTKVINNVNIAGSGGGGSSTKVTPIFNLNGEDGGIDPFGDLGVSDIFIGQLFDLSGQMPVGTTFSVEKLSVRILDLSANDGNYTGIILNNVTDGGITSDHTVVATAETIDVGAIVNSSPNSDSQILEFTFTPAVDITLDGTDFIGIQIEGMTTSNLNTFLNTDMSQVEGICIIANSTDWIGDCGFVLGAGDDFAMELGISDTANLFNSTGGIASDKLVVHQTFDIAQLSDITGFVSSNTDLAKNKTLSNAGTFGSDADLTSYFERGLSSFPQAIQFNSTGLLGESWYHDDFEDVFAVGSESNKDQFDFMHNADIEKTWSANFWLQQDAVNKFIDLTGSTIFLGTLGLFEGEGIEILTTSDKLGMNIFSNETSVVTDFTPITAGIPADTDWHMVTVMVDFTNTTHSATICLDNSCEVLPNGLAPVPSDNSAETTLLISDNDPESHSISLEVLETYSMDELCIWKGHTLSPSDRSTLYNSGSGSNCGTVSAFAGGGGGSSGLTTGDLVNATDTVTITPPTIPEGITDLTGDTVLNTCELSWSAPITTSTINGYRILRQVDGGGFSTLIANTSNTLTTHIDGGLAMNILYEYDILAGNKLGFATVSSNIVDCTPVVSGIPTAPLTLTAINENPDVRLNWLESAEGDPTGYQIQRKVTSSGSWITTVNDTASTSLTFLDTNVLPETEYVYRIGAWNTFGFSPFSNEATINTPTLPDSPILTAEQIGDVIVLNWTEPASGNPINGYKIDRRINLGSLVTYISNTTTTSLSFVDSNVTKPDTFGYRITPLTAVGDGTVSNIVDVVFGSHLIVHVREQDGSGFKGGGFIDGFNSTFSDLIGLNVNSDAIFNNLPSSLFNFTFIDDDAFILNKTFNILAPIGNDTSEFTINALVFDVDCPANGGGTDIRIKVNYTNVKDITEFPSIPVCDSSDQVSWSTTWVGGAVNDTSTMVADFISPVFKANAEQFLASSDVIPTIYNSGANQIESETYVVNMTSVTINFNLFLDRAPSGGGGTPSPPPSAPSTPSIPDPEIVFDQRLTGLNLLSRTHTFAQAGDILTGSVTVNWEGETNLSVKSIDTNLADLNIIFDEQIPFDLNQEISGIGEFAMSSAEITYSIVLPPQDCNVDIGITQNCFDPSLHTLPIEFKFEREGQVYEASTEVFVDGRPIPLDIVQLQVILLFLVLVASAVFGNFIRKRFQKPVRRTKKVKTKFRKKFDSS